MRFVSVWGWKSLFLLQLSLKDGAALLLDCVTSCQAWFYEFIRISHFVVGGSLLLFLFPLDLINHGNPLLLVSLISFSRLRYRDFVVRRAWRWPLLTIVEDDVDVGASPVLL